VRQARFNPVLVSTEGAWVLQADVHVVPVPAPPADPVRSLT